MSMRRLVSKKEKKSNERFKQIIVGLVLVFILLFSMIGYSILSRNDEESGQTKSVVYNGFLFRNMNDFWVTEINNKQLRFKYNPEEIIGVEFNTYIENIGFYKDEVLYIQSFDLEASKEIDWNMYGIVMRINEACIDRENCKEKVPVRDCTYNFIIIQESEDASIIQEEGCVFISGSQEEIIKITDEFLFKIIGIIE